MDFYAVLNEVEDLLRSRGRVSYRALGVHFNLDDELLETLKAELLYAHPDAVRDDGQASCGPQARLAPIDQTPNADS